MGDKEEGFHKSIVRATGIFGFVQVIKLFVKVIVGKFTAIFLGPEGVGLVGLLTNSLDLIGSFTGLGFNITGSRAIAIADSDSDDVKVSETIVVLNKWALIIGVSGAILSSVFSKWLSVLTFGTSDYYYWFIFLSLYFVFSSFTAAYGAILQGKRLLKYIALSSIISTFIIALTTFLLYYFFRKEGIVIVIIVTSLITAIVNFYFVNKIKTANVIISFKEIIKKGIPIIKTGFLLSINVIFGRICFYIIRLFLNQGGASAEILGFYEVSLVIFVSYLGIVFTAMSTDYFPQLTSFKDDKLKFLKLVNHQIEISVLIITPSILFIYLTGPYLLEFLYTKDFKAVYLILKLGLLAMLFKAIIWPLGFMILAKGDNRQYFKQEIVSDFMNISFTIFFYNYFGLLGIGIAMLMNYVLYGIYIYYYLNKKYDFVFLKRQKSWYLSLLFCCL
ncbi:oligosaccharide flippase family protein [Flavobacterium sp. N1861]|uniref:oligosaccharide flippase family protein n=1 Tax=Flavobacterium sp. N1861 TaxID=2986825 RepID=UPI0022241DA1|nr:oligosaccharide flippase family protein [Flavobacterium sp. N1861]